MLGYISPDTFRHHSSAWSDKFNNLVNESCLVRLLLSRPAFHLSAFSPVSPQF